MVLIPYSQILPLPVSLKDKDYQSWPEDEKALAIEANMLYEDYMASAAQYQLL
jgi:hypothetical protein